MKVLKASSGITVLHRQVPSKLVSVRYYINCGSLDEKVRSEFGLCHALEHMFFGGTLTRTWEDIIKDFRKLGAYSNASTGYMCTEYEFLVPAENFAGAFEVAADMMYNATFPEERWEEVEKKAVINELLGLETSPQWVLEDEAFTHAFGGIDVYHNPGGIRESVNSASVQDLIRFRDRFYKGNNIFLSIAGGVSEEEVLSVVNRFDKWDPSAPEARVVSETPFNLDSLDGFKEGCGQPFVYIVKPISKVNDNKDIAAQAIFESLLNNHLMRELREKRGLCYGIHADIFDELYHKDYLAISTSTVDGETMECAIEATHEAMHSLLSEGMDDDSILEARMDVYRDLLDVENDPNILSNWMGEEWVQGKKEDPITPAFEHIKKVSNDQVRSIAREIVPGDYKICTLQEKDELCEED